jgi:hypothetical protein
MEITTFKEYDLLIKKIFFEGINKNDTTNHLNFYKEKLEASNSLNDISQFIITLNKNIADQTYKNKSQEEIDFLANLFNTFLRNIYYANGRMRLQYRDEYNK